MIHCQPRAGRSCLGFIGVFVALSCSLGGCGESRRDNAGGDHGVFSEPDAGGGGGQDHACAETAVTAVLRPVDIFLLLDRSGSMYGAKWEAVASGTTAFLADVFPTRVSVSVTVFPPRGVSQLDEATACSEAKYPARLAALPDGASTVIATLLSSPADPERPEYGVPYFTLTPLAPALSSVLAEARARKAAFPDHEVATVLISDGLPTACEPQTSRAIADLAKHALDEGHVRTYAVGMTGASPSFLTQVAQAGGTERRYDISADPGIITKMLWSILFGSIGCAYDLPSPPEGQELDPTRVNASIERDALVAEPVTAVQSEEECGDEKGWHYDNPSNPKRVVLCPASCADIQGDPTVGVKVLFGCSTRIR